MAPTLSDMDTAQLLALAAALGWASGLRLYLVVFLTGLAGALGWVTLPDGLRLLQQPLLLSASGLMVAAEFLADKVPGIDSLWDMVHTLVRVPAGALLAAGVFGGDHASWALIAALLGGTLAATSHLAKASTRAAVNTSPEPFSNLVLSFGGDAAVPALLWLAWAHPWLALGTVALAALLAGLLIWRLARFLRRLLGRRRADGVAA